MNSYEDDSVIFGRGEDHPFYGAFGLALNNVSVHNDYVVNKLNSSPLHDSQEELSIMSSSNDTEIDHLCKAILYIEIGTSKVRIWDLLLLVPVILFLVGLLWKLNAARLKLRSVQSPIYSTFYSLIWLNVLVAFVRCIVSMTVNASTTSGDEANILLYIVVRFFLLATEMSVVTFAIFFGHLDNRTSIRRVLAVTVLIALPYSAVQAALELGYPDLDYYVQTKAYQLFAHGGSIFFLVSSITFALIYCFLLLLKLDCMKQRFIFLLWMPTKETFYVYLAFLALLNTLQSIGCALYIAQNPIGLCIINLTTWSYFSLLTPLIYFIFVYKFFRFKPSDNVENIVFSYKSEEDDSSPTQPDVTNLPGNVQPNTMAYSSLTEVDSSMSGLGPAINPLYAASLQSPDSITGYSINSCDSINIA